MPPSLERALLLGSVLLSAAACSDALSPEGGSNPNREWVSLVDSSLWQLDSIERDPLVEHREAHVFCDEDAVRSEVGVEISTRACNYASLSQPLSEELSQGDVLHIVAWWSTLTAVEGAVAHLAVLLDGDVVWEENIEIPGDADVRDTELELKRDYAAAARVTIHLHNHGSNSWQLGELSVAR